MQVPAGDRGEPFGTTVTGNVLQGTAMLGIAGKDLSAGLAGYILVGIPQMHPQGPLRVAAAIALDTDGGVDAFLDGFFAEGKAVQHFLQKI